MRRTHNSWMLFLFAALMAFAATGDTLAQNTAAASKTESTIATPALSQAQIDEVIRKFTAKETEFRRALNNYFFKRDALVQEIGMGGQVIGEFIQKSDFTFDDAGNRYEK